ncbi:hypothetical protein HMPREF9123_2603 [Neisseria bacilliformis ATCC BAA-1200]|uniref:Uncharacterized protein n=1 Tax=Neisseria bacilliformis ATCC BAA-1200 TaxID=888742 RepID=F2BFU6_9NEIS|nr:hypothetical protein HMPREF9123_2603 [Neisseria bacilliformis ATCC BAA-1200]
MRYFGRHTLLYQPHLCCRCKRPSENRISGFQTACSRQPQTPAVQPKPRASRSDIPYIGFGMGGLG